MKVTGIIAEYNPFHKGHAYQIAQLRAREHTDYVAVAMSGNFMQRGMPAIVDKYTRAKMALASGADIVFELPACYATASAESFARGGVALFASMGIADSLCFGAESTSLDRLWELSGLLAREPDWYKSSLNVFLKEGCSFPAARAKALPEFADILSMPNNILALEYLKAIRQTGASLTPILIKREGGGYHDIDPTVPLASASAVRRALFAGDMPEHALPDVSKSLLSAKAKEHALLSEDDFSMLLHFRLLSETPESLDQYADFTPPLASRVLRNLGSYTCWSKFCEKCNTKDSTYARFSRLFTHLLLDLKKEDFDQFRRLDTLPYLRILGFRKDAGPLLTRLKASAKAPILTRIAAAEGLLDHAGLRMLGVDLRGSDLYRIALTEKCGHSFPNEYQQQIILSK